MSSPAEILPVPGPQDSASEQVRRYIETPVEFWEECAAYGPIVALNLGSIGSVVLFSDPESIRDIFLLPAEAFEVKYYNEHYRHVMGDNSVLVQDGERHKRQRRLLMPPFRPDQLYQREPALRVIIRQQVNAWPSGRLFNPRPSLHDIGFQAILDLIFGNTDSPVCQELLNGYRDAVLRQVGSSWGPWRNFSRMQPRIRELLADEIRDRQVNTERPGFLTQLAQAKDADGSPLPSAECEDHVFSFMVAGVDTSAVSMTWALHWLVRQPEVAQRLSDELASEAHDGTTRSLMKLPYLDAVFRETVRMYPIVPTPSGRRLTRDTKIASNTFAAGTTLVPCTYLAHRREDIFPDPTAFNPDRFLGRKYAFYEYFPFGGGIRTCLGESMSQMEFKIGLEIVLNRWRLMPSDGPALRPVRHGTLLAPSEGFEIQVEPKEGAPASRE